MRIAGAQRRFVLSIGWVWLASLAVAPSVQADSVERLAEELVKLRGEVEELNAELDRKKANHRTDMRALQAQRAELQAETQREQLRIEKLKASLTKQREIARKAGIDQQELKPVVYRALDDLEALIRRSLPFKTSERLSEVDALRRQVQTDVLTPHKAVSRLWGLYEDEIRLASENGLDRQAIQLNGEERLADVARLGMVMMYFRTSGGDYGRVVNSGGRWQYEVLPRAADQDRVATLFDSLNRQIRTGYFELPAPFTRNILVSEKP
ncbi:MAG: DUF3450 family protein [Nitrospirota bacterium]